AGRVAEVGRPKIDANLLARIVSLHNPINCEGAVLGRASAKLDGGSHLAAGNICNENQIRMFDGLPGVGDMRLSAPLVPIWRHRVLVPPTILVKGLLIFLDLKSAPRRSGPGEELLLPVHYLRGPAGMVEVCLRYCA